MAAGKSSRINRQYKTKYRIRNWREYERGLRNARTSIWLSEDAIAAWIPPKNGFRGGQRRYSNLAIRTALTLRVVFGLPLRQTEAWRSAFCSRAHRGTSTWRSRREACNRSRVPRDALSPGSPPISRGSGGSARVCRIDASLSSMWCALCNRRSQMVPAWFESPMMLCQSGTGRWLAMS